MKVFVTAGEASGDKLGAALMIGLRELRGDVEFTGIGGERMIGQGLDSLFPMDEISIMGIGEILKEYRHLKARIRQTADAILAQRPDVVVTIDLPEFSLRVARLVKAVAPEIKIVHYVAPTVWAWRPGRAEKMRGLVDKVLALLPFEPEYMQRAGVPCDFVGHPVVLDPVASDAEAEAFRAAQGITGEMALVLPGSRRSEIARLLPIFQEVAERLVHERPGLELVIPAASNVAPAVREAVSRWPERIAVRVIDPREDPTGAIKRAAFKAADVALAASGTVSLELAAVGTPMVIAYDMSWLSRQIIGRMLLVDTVTLVNLVSETRAVPEYIGKDCKPSEISKAVCAVLDAPGAQRAAMDLTMERLGRGGEAPGLRAARAVLALNFTSKE
ncbi:lipid-A-disaccharide synthase [Tropicibacter naphthalenivorans]|uniref:Lipid-A-disaccharide synthase n=1 Tax=Tropicibacter naphthalenivorans TaxID=441103 RepID=A0A0N7LZB4_9RHOB|nr:lipid-A-disaccharide synthase [Tropicibacter naphthalenivorans]CUH77193.1 Lipid-A-disaccharide synthase [Tropicibacter naphthalenivorans]SMC60056.1 lipid-A-disaccharide synthase [Tropicibacter naphthalenivorans]